MDKPFSNSRLNAALRSNGALAPTYEQLMSQDLGWAMSQGSLFFEGGGQVQETLRRIAKRLDELNIPYAVVGGMALFAHGFRRYTEDIDILVTPLGLAQIHQALDGLGYVPPFERSKHLRDTETHVKIEFLTTGGFPGDGRPKPVSFPDPAMVYEELKGIKYARLKTIIELKLASGMTNVHREKDLVDVQELIQKLNLPESLAAELDSYVRDKYLDLWRKITVDRRFKLFYHHTKLQRPIESIDELISLLGDKDPRLAEMKKDGVAVDVASGVDADGLFLVSHKREIADKYGMQLEDEFQ